MVDNIDIHDKESTGTNCVGSIEANMVRTADNKCRKWVVMVAVYSAIILISTSSFMGGILYVAILNKYNGNKAIASLIISLNSGLLALLGPLASVVIDKFSCRVSMVTGGLLLTVSGLSSAFVQDMNLLILTFGVVGGTGYALSSTPCSIILAYYFNNKRSFVIALATAVIGLGMFIASPIALYILDNLSLEETFLIIGAFNSHLCVIGMICKPSMDELDIQRKTKFSRDEYRLENRNSIVSFCNCSIWTNITFVFFLMSTMTWNAVLSICLVHLPYYASVLGSNDIQIALLMTCFSISNTSGRFLSAFTVAKSSLNILVLHIFCLGSLGIANVTYPLYSVFYIAKFIFAVIVGLFTGAPNSLMTPITLQMTGVENISTAHGLEYLFCGAGYLAGPPIAGFLYGNLGSYRYSFIFSGCASFLGTLFAIMALCKGNRRGKIDTLKEIQRQMDIETATGDESDKVLLDKELTVQSVT